MLLVRQFLPVLLLAFGCLIAVPAYADSTTGPIKQDQLIGHWKVDARIMAGVILNYLEKQSPSKTEKAKAQKKMMALSIATNSPVELVFEDSNKAKMITGPNTVDGSYTIKANTVSLTFTANGNTQTSTATLNKGILELAISEDVKNAPFKAMPFVKIVPKSNAQDAEAK